MVGHGDPTALALPASRRVRSIPKGPLMDALGEHQHMVIRIDDQLADPGRVDFHNVPGHHN